MGLQTRLAIGREMAASTMHLTLAFLDEQTEAQLFALHEELELLQVSAFELTLQGLDLFGGARSRALAIMAKPDPMLAMLQTAVVRAARRAGLSLANRKFRPHVTVARLKDGQQSPHGLQAAMDRGAGVVIGPTPVTGFALYRSTLSSSGAHHEILSDYPLITFAPDAD